MSPEVAAPMTGSAAGCETAGPPASGRRPALWPFLLLAAVLIGTVHVGVFVRDGMHSGQRLRDTDAYMWMNRATHLWETGDWFDHVYPRINPPEGHQQHWTRPLDAVLLAGALMSSPAASFEDGLYWWSVILPPLLHLLTLVLLVWVVRPLIRGRILDPGRLPTVLLVFLAQMGIFQAFLAGRPDHHAPLALLYVAYLGYWVRTVLDPEGYRRAAIGLGVTAAIGVWVNVEAMVYVVLGMSGFGIAWIMGHRSIARAAAVHALALLGASGAALLMEWGRAAPGIREMDTLSIAHVGLFALAAAFWCALWWMDQQLTTRSTAGRVAMAGTGVLLTLTAIRVLLPEFLGSPLANVDPLYRETRLRHISELQPLLHGSFLVAVRYVILFGGIAILAIPYAVFRALRQRDIEVRTTWIILGAASAAYLVMALQQRRWVDYLAISALIPFAMLTIAAVDSVSGRARGALRAPVLFGLVLGPFLTFQLLGAVADERPALEGADSRWVEVRRDPTQSASLAHANADQPCDLVRIGRLLADRDRFPASQLILAHPDHGPELLYRTHHAVLSIPNHRRQPGYTFTRRVLADPDHRAAATALRERDVGIIVLCRTDITWGWFHFPEVERPFVDVLAAGGVPAGYELFAFDRGWRIYRSIR